MKCPKCGKSITSRRLRFLQYVNIVEEKCSCGYSRNYAEISKNKEGEVLLRLLRSLLDKGNLNSLLSEMDRKKFDQILRKIGKKILSLEPFDIIENMESEVDILKRMKRELLSRYQNNIYAGAAGKGILEEIKILDINIQSAKQQSSQSELEQRVYLFEFDGKEHADEVMDESTK